MNLIRFLSSGSRGLSKGAPPMGRYRLPDGTLIPNFGSGKNPFASKTLPSQGGTSPAAGVTARAASTQAAPPSSVHLQPGQRTTAQHLTALLEWSRRMGTRAWRITLWAVHRVKLLAGSFGSMLPRGKTRTFLATSSAPRPAGPVQGELSLENVRVVRNDLTDTDYEVVCGETTTASPVTRAPQIVPVPTSPRRLGRLAERLFSQKTS